MQQEATCMQHEDIISLLTYTAFNCWDYTLHNKPQYMQWNLS